MIWSDEKQFNCDELDRLNCYLHGLRWEELDLSRRQHGTNGVVVKALICSHGKTELVLVYAILNGKE